MLFFEMLYYDLLLHDMHLQDMFYMMWLLTSYDMDCDIVADAKCGSASVPIKRYLLHKILNT